MIMSSLTIIQGLIFISYVAFLMIKFKGPLPSISDSWYMLSGLQKSLFTWFCFTLGFLMLFQTNGEAPYIFFVSGAGLSLVGVATMFKLDHSIEPKLHALGAIVCVVAALIGNGLEKGVWFPAIHFAIVAVILSFVKMKNKTWWIEILAFLAIFIGLSL